MLFKLGRGYLRSTPAVLRGVSLYVGLFLRAGVVMSAFAAPAQGAELPVPCGGGACAAGGNHSVWVSSGNVRAPTVTGNTMHINQESDKAILNWSSFNIGAGGAVDFKQPSSSSVALNRIFQNDPSKILGALHANGQIYLYNQNGFLFGKGATVDVHGLVASTLDVSDKLFKSSGIAQAINQSTPAAAFTAQGKMGDINIARGAVIKTDDGGQVMIFAPNITNDGEIDTPRGQTILAASKDKVYLKINSPNDPGLRGFLVEVNEGGTVTNGGKISVGEGNATLEGLAVNQDGVVSANTSVQLNGSVRLIARDHVDTGNLSVYSKPSSSQLQVTTQAGSVTLGNNSLTQVSPDPTDTSTTADAQKQLPSTVDIMGKTIDLKPGAKVIAHGGQVDLTATTNPENTTHEQSVAPNDSRILMEAQSLIDVSGTTDTVLPMDRNLVHVQLRGNELKDSPIQRSGILYGKTVAVDARTGTPLADVSAAVNNTKRGITERLSPGGTVKMSSEGDVAVNRRAEVNFSGGQVRYKGGYLDTTKLYAQNGTVVDIGNADPNQTYTAILGAYQQDHKTWGITRSYQVPGIDTGSSYQPGYVQGMDAGTLTVQGRGVVLDGQLQGSRTVGRLQRQAPAGLNGSPAWARSYNQLPLGGQLTIGDPSQVSQFPANFRAPAVTFENQVTPTPVAPGDPRVEQPLALGADLFQQDGITRVAVYSNGSITIPSGVTLGLGPGGALSLTAGTSGADAGPSAPVPPSLDIQGAITVPGGSVTLVSHVTSTKGLTQAAQQAHQSIVLGKAARIDAGGMWVNDLNALNPGGATGPAVIDGGSVSVSAPGDVTLAKGSVINVDGGAQVLEDGTVKPGAGGDVSLSSKGAYDVSTLTLDGALQSDALYQGGTLSLTADGIQIQGPDAGGQPKAGVLVLNPATFTSNGFSNFDLQSTHFGISVADNTTVNLVQQNFLLDVGYQQQPTGTHISQVSHLEQLPLPIRRPVNLSLISKRDGQNDINYDAGLTIGKGALIQTDPQAQVFLASDRMITIGGTINAPAGNIGLTLLDPLSKDGFYADKAIWLVPGARLAAPAYVMLTPNDLGQKQGKVLDAGTISLTAKEGQIVTASGSAMDVSGRSQTLSVLTDTGDRSSYVPTKVAGAAGSILLTAADGMYLDGAMNAKAADVPGAAGGRLSVSLQSASRGQEAQHENSPYYAPKGVRRIQVSAAGDATLPNGTKPGDSLFSQAELDQLHSASDNSVSAVAHVPAARIQQGGFDSVDLKVQPVMFTTTKPWSTSGATIEFKGNVSLDVPQRITLDAPILQTQDSQVNLNAAYVALGSSDTYTQQTGTPSAGGGSLTVKAGFIDLVGETALQGFGSASSPAVTLQAGQAIRLRGVRVAKTQSVAGDFRAAGDMELSAGQIYPSTLSQFTLAMTGDPQGTIRISGNGSRPAPLSAGGNLILSAPNIVQGGILRAPFGGIEFDASQSLQLKAGSVTSVSGTGLTVPFGKTQFGRDWVIPYQQVPGEIGPWMSVVTQQQGQPYDMALPQKRVSLNAASVSLDKGATIDVAGGGSLYASEFLPGPGGSQDILSAANADGAFAVVPSLGSLYAPVDPVISSQGLQPGDSVYLSGANGLPTGQYAMLPARYALLPGAFLIRPVAGTTGMAPGYSYPQLDGIPVVAGRRQVAGTDIHSSLWSGYAVLDGAQVRQRAKYTQTYADQFFSTDANGAATGTPLPQDAGAVTIAAQQGLSLGGHIDGRSANGRGAQVDIVAQQLQVVNQVSADATGIQILASDLNNLGAASLLLGGQRQVTGDGVAIQAQARSVRIDSNVSLTLPELILAASTGQGAAGSSTPGQVTVAGGATLRGSGKASTDEGTLLLQGDSAMLRIAAGPQPTLQRTNLPSTPASQLTVAPGAVLIAGNGDASGSLKGGSLILDSAGGAQSAGDIQIGSGGALRMGAARISLGDVGGLSGNQGLALSNAALGKLDVANMSLISTSGIDLYGAATVHAHNLTLQAQGINGYSNDGQTATLQADNLNLVGGSSGQAGAAGTGSGTLDLKAQRVNLGTSDPSASGAAEALGVSGFGQVNLDTGELKILGKGNLQLAGITDISAGRIDGGPSANWGIGTADVLSVTGNSPAPAVPAAPALAASLSLQGSRLSFDSAVLMPSGRLTLAATGSASTDGVVIGPHASIDLSGRAVDFGKTTVASPGGRLALSSASGDVQIKSGAKVDVAGANAGAAGGVVSIRAPKGQATIRGVLSANPTSGGNGQGGFSLDASSIVDFSSLTNLLNQGGFTGTVAIHTHSGGLQVASSDTLKAHDLTLTADGGNIDIYGAINASGSQGGRVSLNAGGNLSVYASARIDAHATGTDAKGGSVSLGSVHGDLTFAQGALIDVSGTQKVSIQLQQAGQTVTRTDTGTVQFRVPRASLLASSSNLAGAAGGITGAALTVVDGYRAYDLPDGALKLSAGSTYWQDAAAFMQNQSSILAGLGLSGASNVQLRPGIELDASGALSLAVPLDLSQWRFGSQKTIPGILTLRAGGNLDISNNLSAGFGSGNVLTSTDSWSLQLVGGADIASANPLDVRPGAGNVTVGNNVTVRTGTGNTDIAAGGDLVFGNNQSTVYTAGVDGAYRSTLNPQAAYAFLGGQYPLGGGDVRVSVMGNIESKPSQQLVSDWLTRIGGPTVNYGTFPTAWAIKFGSFHQGIGALGGGNVSISAGGNIDNLSVVMPTIGAQVGKANYSDFQNVTVDTNQVEVSGGTHLRVNAGGDIVGGLFYAGQGQADINAAGSLLTSSQTSAAPILAMNDAQVNVLAGGDLRIETVLNPTILPQSRAQGASGSLASYFFTYGADSAVQLTSLSGDVSFSNDNNGLLKDFFPVASFSTSSFSTSLLSVYPGTLSASALQGNIDLANNLTLFPEPRGQLSLLAAKSVTIPDGQTPTVNLSDADPGLMPSVGQPSADVRSTSNTHNRLNVTGDANLIHAATPVHTGDTSPALIIARDGNIGAAAGGTGQLLLYLAKPFEMVAGQDVRNTAVTAQNLSANDVSLIQAGGSMTFSSVRDGKTGVLSDNKQLKYNLSGPGTLEILAGGNVDLGTSNGVSTLGNTSNPALPQAGAGVLVMTGLSQKPDYSGFIKRYLVNSSEYQVQLESFLSNYTVSDPKLTGVAKLQALPLEVQRQFVMDVFFSELKASGITAANSQNKDYSRGFTAIDALFPGSVKDQSGADGNLSLLLSRIATVAGGGITLVVPRGEINAGVADTSALQKKTSQLGIVVQGTGDIRTYVRGDFNINQSRVFTLDGGNILAWSSLGNIDAGRGAKTALAVVPPKVQVKSNGQLLLTFPAAIAGSGIRAAVTTPGKAPGNVYLFAPKGVVNAGDAGIASQGNLTIGASHVLGASNINVGGVSIGVPSATPVSVAAGLTGLSSASSSVSKSASNTVNAMTSKAVSNTPLADAALSYLKVVVISLGNLQMDEGQ